MDYKSKARAHEFYSLLITDDLNGLSMMLVDAFKAIIIFEGVAFSLNKDEFIARLKKIRSDNIIEIDHLHAPTYISKGEVRSICIEGSTLQKWKPLGFKMSTQVNLYDFSGSMTLKFDEANIPKTSHLNAEYKRFHLGHEIASSVCYDDDFVQVNTN